MRILHQRSGVSSAILFGLLSTSFSSQVSSAFFLPAVTRRTTTNANRFFINQQRQYTTSLVVRGGSTSIDDGTATATAPQPLQQTKPMVTMPTQNWSQSYKKLHNYNKFNLY